MIKILNWERLSKSQKRQANKLVKGTPTFPHKSSREVFYVLDGKIKSYFDHRLIYALSPITIFDPEYNF